jgi:hypothetical protein
VPTHVSVVHALLSVGASSMSSATTVWPMASQTSRVQSAGSASLTSVPAGSSVVPQMLPTQVGAWQALWEHCSGASQPTHCPAWVQ